MTDCTNLTPLTQQNFLEQRSYQRAFWLEPKIFALYCTDENCHYWLHSGKVRINDGVIYSDHAYALMPTGIVGDRPEMAHKFPYLGGHLRLENEAVLNNIPTLIKGELLIAVHRPDGKAVSVTGVQTFGLLDQVAAYEENDLGVSVSNDGTPTLKLWAPTATHVKLQLFKNPKDTKPWTSIDMTPPNGGGIGVWSVTGTKDWYGQYFLYDVEVFVPELGALQHNLVTDPYSTSLATNSKKSQILSLDDKQTKPEGWDYLFKHPEDIVIYELHIRDFSISDSSVPNEKRGHYAAFAEKNSNGVKHLRELAACGLTHVHLLPTADFATVNEDPAQQKNASIPEGLPPDSPKPQALIAEVRDHDGYNWGYDPFHYFAPEGSYAGDPDGPSRIKEFRTMIQGLHEAGLRVIMDVVFNHTYKTGQDPRSVLDRVVPGYYHRVGLDGTFQKSSWDKCADTASERFMMEKLMIDSIVSWARNYKIDGFRFDLMGLHTVENLRAIRAALDALTPEKDGVDGKKIFLYGEGWKFGSLDAILPTHAATQHNVFGLGVGTFNDRIRDRIRGGDFRAETKSDQGFLTGLHYDDNGLSGSGKVSRDFWQQRDQLLEYADVIRVGMTGNLRDYRFQNRFGQSVRGAEIDYNGSAVGYAARPSETINYASAHDNYDLWDHIAAKMPFQKPDRTPPTASMDQRVRAQKLGLGLIALAQGVPFFHAGSEILRSKSGDNNSYNSGDWFNRLDFSYETNNWGVGLPPGTENAKEWDFWAPRLRDPSLKPSRADILSAKKYFMALLSVRKSSPLFRLTSLEQVQARLRFLESDYGPAQPPGFIAMALRDDLGDQTVLDKERSWIFAFFNVTLTPIQFTHNELKEKKLTLHSRWNPEIEPRIAEAKFDSLAGSITVPAQSLLVYEVRR